jgi:hypothetical protein
MKTVSMGLFSLIILQLLTYPGPSVPLRFRATANVTPTSLHTYPSKIYLQERRKRCLSTVRKKDPPLQNRMFPRPTD